MANEKQNHGELQNLADAIRENLSPEAVAVIAAHIQGAECSRDQEAGRQARWFGNWLSQELLGSKIYNDLLEEVGL